MRPAVAVPGGELELGFDFFQESVIPKGMTLKVSDHCEGL